MSQMQRTLSLTAMLFAFALSGMAQTSSSSQLANDQVPLDYISTHGSADFKIHVPHSHAVGGHTSHGIPGIDSLINFSGQFHADGYDSNGNANAKWLYNMIGTMPEHGGTTVVNAPIVPVGVDLLDYDGSVRYHLDAKQYLNNVLNSPIFKTTTYSSSTTATQFTDAVQRAEFYNSAKQDWHTMLNPSVKTERTMKLPRGTYQFATYSNGTIAYVLVDYDTFSNLLFPSTPTDTTTPIGAAENAHEITTKDLSTFLFPNIYLFQGSDCCVLGYHSYDYEPGDASSNQAEKRYVVDYSSWISPGLFGGGFQDITALSHEIAEAYNDPFVASDGAHNITPWWQAPNGLCQNNLETGDVIEGLANGVYPMAMNGYTYHPQNEALIQWFEFKSPSDAIMNTYSYPDMTTLTSLSAPQKAGCQ
jgi:hypothetical protein